MTGKLRAMGFFFMKVGVVRGSSGRGMRDRGVRDGNVEGRREFRKRKFLHDW